MDSEYLKYLPRPFKDGPAEDVAFLGQYLKIFEALLTGREDSAGVTGLEQQLSLYINHLDAAYVPQEEISFLARWVALTFDQNWPLEKKRQWLQKIVPLYKKRGTTSGLIEYLHMFVGKQVKIEEPVGGFILGEESTLGFDTYIGGTPPYYFRVMINYGYPEDEAFDLEIWKNLDKGVHTIVDQEKPAHTYYNVDIRSPGFVVGEIATVGKDTLIWNNVEKVDVE